ncbi:MAG TPA: glycosyltransferase, partial [Syntrophales bacterium]|nr:glycosyltransferase [Syntrophales bacterium]
MKIVIAGGGTGGHLFPGVAIAEEFRRRSKENDVLFIGTKRGIEARVLPQIGFPLATLEVEGVKGRGLIRSLAALAKIPRSLLQSRRIIGGFGPGIVIGVGGYASGPAVLAAHFMSLPTVIAEQNAIPGETNRILGKF